MTALYEPHADNCTCRDCRVPDLVQRVIDSFYRAEKNMTDRAYNAYLNQETESSS